VLTETCRAACMRVGYIPVAVGKMLQNYTSSAEIVLIVLRFRNMKCYTGWLKKTGTLCFVCLNFIICWPIFKLISLSELGEDL